MTTRHSTKGIKVAQGLKEVVSHATQLSEVHGQAGRLVIRGYDIHELVGAVAFEETAYLLWHGDLPNPQQLGTMQGEMAVARHLPGPVMDVLRGAARQASGMHALRMRAAALSLDEPRPDDLSP
jgi:citrate synthase